MVSAGMSRVETTPSTCSPLTTTRWRNEPSSMRRTASSTGSSAPMVTGSAVMAWRSLVVVGSRPAATTRTRRFALGEDAEQASVLDDEDAAATLLGHALGRVADRLVGVGADEVGTETTAMED